MAKLSGKTAVSWVSQITADYKLILLKTQSAEKYKITLHILTMKNNFSSLEDICQNTCADKWVTYYLFVYGSICHIWIYDSITPSSKGRANWTFITVLKNWRDQVGWQKASPLPPPAPVAHGHKICKWKSLVSSPGLLASFPDLLPLHFRNSSDNGIHQPLLVYSEKGLASMELCGGCCLPCRS